VLPKRSFASGDMAIDKLPIPPDLASGDIIINGTAVLCNLSVLCAEIEFATKNKTTNKAVLIEAILIILKNFNFLY
jgi:hypothetical protein